MPVAVQAAGEDEGAGEGGALQVANASKGFSIFAGMVWVCACVLYVCVCGFVLYVCVCACVLYIVVVCVGGGVLLSEGERERGGGGGERARKRKRERESARARARHTHTHRERERERERERDSSFLAHPPTTPLPTYALTYTHKHRYGA